MSKKKKNILFTVVLNSREIKVRKPFAPLEKTVDCTKCYTRKVKHKGKEFVDL